MKTLDELRAEVDRSDDRIVEALKARFAATDEIGRVKRAQGLAVDVPGRERAVIDRLADALPRADVERVWQAIFAASKARQARVGSDGDLDGLYARYRAYVDAYREPDGALPKMMELKLRHTMNVVAAAKAIAAGEGFDARLARACEAAALLHDTGRYEQLKRYDTFRDSESVDHAAFSFAIVREQGWLSGWADGEAILTSVRVHNCREIPSDITDEFTLACARCTRDSDKLDIFHVLEDQVENCDWRTDSRAFWNLSTTKAPNPAVVEAILKGRPVDYQNIRSLADFVLIQLGWMASGLEFATSRRLCAERGHLEFRRKFLHELSADPAIDEVCDFAADRLKAD